MKLVKYFCINIILNRLIYIISCQRNLYVIKLFFAQFIRLKVNKLPPVLN